MTNNPSNKIDWLMAAKARAFKCAPYLASPLWSLRIVYKDDLFVPGSKEPTLAVDKYWRMYVNPACGDKWTLSEAAGAIYHEICHLIREHAERCELNRLHPGNWNIAADLEINDEQLPEGLKYPPHVLTPRQFKFPDGLLAEEYYALLRKQAQKNGRGNKGNKGNKSEGDGEGGGGIPWYEDGEGNEGDGRPGEGSCGGCADGTDRHYQDAAPPSGSGKGVGKAEAGRLRRDVAARIKEASQERGTVPAGWARWAEVQMGEKRVDWRTLFRAAVRSSLAYKNGMGDYTYSRPSRRQTCVQNIILPGQHRPLPSVALLVDTSGSMDDESLSAIITEIKNILQVTEMTKLYVIACDAAVHWQGWVSNARHLELGGGGGTDMRVGFQVAQELKPAPQVLVVATDTYTPWPDVPPTEFKTVVVKTVEDGNTPEWARTVYLDPHKSSKS
jgi:predicted metal-dependent peptidase